MENNAHAVLKLRHRTPRSIQHSPHSPLEICHPSAGSPKLITSTIVNITLLINYTKDRVFKPG
eukprot:scaffold3898_cov401-Prasinococcus_capsulatus_cf.AAC.5